MASEFKMSMAALEAEVQREDQGLAPSHGPTTRAHTSSSRKRPGDYSDNPNSKKSRLRVASMNQYEKYYHQKLVADRVAASRARNTTMRSDAYKEASADTKARLIAQAVSDCERKR